MIGKRPRAVAQSEYAAANVGVMALVGLAGALIVTITLFTPSKDQRAIITVFVVVVISGLGDAVRAVVCGLARGVLEALASIFVSDDIGAAASPTTATYSSMPQGSRCSGSAQPPRPKRCGPQRRD